MLGLEAGQAAFGDLLDWVSRQAGESQDRLSSEAAKLQPGANGLLTIDFHAGNRCPFADAELSGITLGQTLQTSHAESYRSAVEALAMGIRQVIDLMASSDVAIDDLLACGGIAAKNPFVLQVIADVTNKDVFLSDEPETCALGACIFGAVAAGEYESAETAQKTFSRVSEEPVSPNRAHQAAYSELFSVWTETQKQFAVENGPVTRMLQFRAKP
jgi:L-ribulokinase